jgi:hypothetical protein
METNQNPFDESEVSGTYKMKFVQRRWNPTNEILRTRRE